MSLIAVTVEKDISGLVSVVEVTKEPIIILVKLKVMGDIIPCETLSNHVRRRS